VSPSSTLFTCSLFNRESLHTKFSLHKVLPVYGVSYVLHWSSPSTNFCHVRHFAWKKVWSLEGLWRISAENLHVQIIAHLVCRKLTTALVSHVSLHELLDRFKICHISLHKSVHTFRGRPHLSSPKHLVDEVSHFFSNIPMFMRFFESHMLAVFSVPHSDQGQETIPAILRNQINKPISTTHTITQQSTNHHPSPFSCEVKV